MNSRLSMTRAFERPNPESSRTCSAALRPSADKRLSAFQERQNQRPCADVVPLGLISRVTPCEAASTNLSPARDPSASASKPAEIRDQLAARFASRRRQPALRRSLPRKLVAAAACPAKAVNY